MNKQKKSFKFLIAVLLFVFIFSGLFFMLFEKKTDNEFVNKDMWFDESFTVLFTERSYYDLVTEPLDVHPPLYYLLVKGYSQVTDKIFNNPYRAFSFTCFCLFLIVNYFIFMKLSFEDNEHLPITIVKMIFYCVVVSIITSFTYYSFEARMYTLILFLFSLSLYFYLEFEYDEYATKKDNNYVTICLFLHYFFIALCILTHYYMIFGFLFFVLLNVVKRFFVFQYYILNIFTVILFVPTALYVLLYGITQFKMMDNLWLPMVNAFTLFNTWLSYFMYSNNPISFSFSVMFICLFIFFMPIAYMLINKKIQTKELDMFIMYYLSLLLPLIGIIISLFFGAYHHRYFFFCITAFLPLFVIFWFKLFDSAVISRNRIVFVCVIIFIVLFGLCLSNVITDSKFTGNTEMQQISEFLNQNVSSGDIIIHSSTFSMIPMMYYTNDTFDNYLLSINVTQKQLNTAGGVIIPDRYHKIKVLNYVPNLDYNSTCELLNLSDQICHHKNIYYLYSDYDFFNNNSVTIKEYDGIRIERLRMI